LRTSASCQLAAVWNVLCDYQSRRPGAVFDREEGFMPVLSQTQLHELVENELSWDPEVTARTIGVVADDGIVTLSGYVPTYAERIAAERAALRVHGVRAVANDLTVRLRAGRLDADIAADAAQALRLHAEIPETVQAAVHNAVVTLTGEAKWAFQAHEAERTIRHVKGVRAVHNYISVVPRAVEKDVRHRIVEALHHNANVDSRQIDVAIVGETAELTGSVSTWLQRETAERAAANAPGIRRVHNKIIVMPPPIDGPDEIC
jgi:osmotically-inducible protein OsmY